MNYEKQVSHLIDGAEELVDKLKDSQNPDVRRLRDRVNAYVSDARQAKPPARGAGSVKLTRIPGSLIDYVRDHPFLAVLTAASVAWTLSHLSAATRERVTEG